MGKRILSFLLFFLYVANIQFVFLPDKIRTRIIISIIGFIYYFLWIKKKNRYRIADVVKLILPLSLWMGFSVLANGSTQIWFLQYVVLQVAFMFGAVFVIHVGRIYQFSTLLWFIVIYVGIQDLIAFVSFQMPQISNLMRMIQISELSAERTQLLDLRAVGFGEFAVFGGGVWIAIGILCLTMLYKTKKIVLPIYASLLTILLGTGLFVARTSLTGLISLVLLLFPIKRNVYKGVLLFIFGIAFMSIMQYQESYFESKGLNTSYAFEIFDKFRSSGKFESNSFEATNNMWKILPTSTKTWIMGDAKYEDERGGYYMHTDVGYLRVIFYGGLIGLFFYLYYIFRLSRLAYERSGGGQDMKLFIGLYYLLVLVWMWKGHYDTNSFLYLLIFSAMINQKTRIRKAIE